MVDERRQRQDAETRPLIFNRGAARARSPGDYGLVDPPDLRGSSNSSQKEVPLKSALKSDRPRTMSNVEKSSINVDKIVDPANCGMSAEFLEEIRRVIKAEVMETIQKSGSTKPSSHLGPSTTSSSAVSSALPSPADASFPGNLSAPPPAGNTSKPSVRFSDRRTFSKRQAHARTPSATWSDSASDSEFLFDDRGTATAKCEQYLQRMARHIMYEYEPKNGSVVTPDKLGAFFAKYKLDSEPFPFADRFRSRASDAEDRIADFFSELACEYHLVPREPNTRPRIPALTAAGFAHLLITCMLAHPDEEFKRLERTVADVPLFTTSAPPSASNPGASSSADSGYSSSGGNSRASDKVDVQQRSQQQKQHHHQHHQEQQQQQQLVRSFLPPRYDTKARDSLRKAFEVLVAETPTKKPASTTRHHTSVSEGLNRDSKVYEGSSSDDAPSRSRSRRRRYQPSSLQTIGDEFDTDYYDLERTSDRDRDRNRDRDKGGDYFTSRHGGGHHNSTSSSNNNDKGHHHHHHSSSGGGSSRHREVSLEQQREIDRHGGPAPAPPALNRSQSMMYPAMTRTYTSTSGPKASVMRIAIPAPPAPIPSSTTAAAAARISRSEQSTPVASTSTNFGSSRAAAQSEVSGGGGREMRSGSGSGGGILKNASSSQAQQAQQHQQHQSSTSSSNKGAYNAAMYASSNAASPSSSTASVFYEYGGVGGGDQSAPSRRGVVTGRSSHRNSYADPRSSAAASDHGRLYYGERGGGRSAGPSTPR